MALHKYTIELVLATSEPDVWRKEIERDLRGYVVNKGGSLWGSLSIDMTDITPKTLKVTLEPGEDAEWFAREIAEEFRVKVEVVD